MQLTLLCVGDVVGGPGRQVLRQALEVLVDRHRVDCVIVNAENVAGGSGLTAALYEKLVRYGVDLITLGDHVYRRRDIIPVLETSDRIVRPANLPMAAPGRTAAVATTRSGHKVAVISLLGRMFMPTQANCPFAAVDRVLDGLPSDVKVIVVDMHAEVTSEKIAMGWHLDGRVSVVFGTHTHVPTGDARVLPGGTAYMTDLGMTGPYDSVLGRCKHRVLSALTTGVPTNFDVATDDVRLRGALISVEAGTGRATSIEAIEFMATADG
jgi:hypothetical protein